VKLQNPRLNVWIITGDGDSLSIGGNHFAHIIRRNINVNIILFNNEIYGLTKGQYSPTSRIGTQSKSTPLGSIDRAFSPAKFAFGAGASFFARSIDTDPKHMIEVFKKAQEHQGCSVIEVYQNCNIFNDKVHDQYTNRLTRDDFTVRLEENQPLIFGKQKNKKLVSEGFGFRSVDIKDDREAIIHRPEDDDYTQSLTNLNGSNGPIPLGVLKQVERPLYEEDFFGQIKSEKERSPNRRFKDLLHEGNTWRV
jgi:2-oxoglutarate ferredoxin oxidoreductase subunit beta